jgi:hypothetical protein
MEGHSEDYFRHLLICIPTPVPIANLIIMLSKLPVLWEVVDGEAERMAGAQDNIR